jgi:hypothetical protein
MPGSNNFLQFDSTLNNAYSDANYAELSQIAKGIQIGIADPMMHNKLFYQLSTFVAAYAQVFANLGYVVNDSSISALTTVLSNTLTTNSLWQSFTGDFHSQTTKGFYVTAAAGQTDAPTSGDKYYLIVATTGTLVYHLAIDAATGLFYFEIYNTTWSAWSQMPSGASGSVTAVMLATGAAIANIGYIPANKAGDTFTGTVTAPNFSGPLTGNVTGNLTGSVTGNVTGNVSGSSGSCMGNSATTTLAAAATELANARLINGISFNGTANIANADYVVAQSLGTNGYTKWNSGKIEQWGSSTVGGGSQVTITFPTSFVSAVYDINPTLTNYTLGTSGNNDGVLAVASYGLSSFNVCAGSSSGTFTWHAIGV